MSLYQLEKDGDIDELLEHLRQSHSPAVRERAAKILGQLAAEAEAEGEGEGERVAEHLVDLVQHDDDETVRAAAIDALDEIGQAAVERLMVELSDDVTDPDGVPVEVFVEGLSADQPELRMVAANALGRRGEVEAVPALCDRLDDPDPRVRQRAARACGQLADERAVDPLVAGLSDSNVAVKREAAEALGAIGTADALSALLDLLDDDNETIRRIAVTGLGNFEDERPVEPLVGALTDESNVVRRAALFSLLALLSNASTERSHTMRETIVDALEETDDGTIVERLVEVLEGADGTAQRRNAAWLLGRVTGAEGRAAAIGGLIDALSDDDRLTAQFAATSLVAIGGDDVETALLELLDGPAPDVGVQAQAVFVLGKVGGERSLDRLETLLESADDELLRRRVFSAISKLGGRS